MAWTTPRTWVTSEVVSASLLNTHVRDNLNALYSPPYAHVYQTTATSLANAAWTTIGFDTETADSTNMHDTSTNNSRITIGTAGLYLVVGQVAFATTSSTGSRSAQVTLNGTTQLITSSPASALAHTTIVTGFVQCTAGQYLELKAYHTYGSAMNTTTGATGATQFQARWMQA